MSVLSHLRPSRVQVLGIGVDNVDLSQAVFLAAELAREKGPSVLIAANLNFAQLANADPNLLRANTRSALTVADGMSLVLASKFLSVPLRQRITGSELLEGICQEAALCQQTLFFVGCQPTSTALAIEYLKKKFPGLRVTGVENEARQISAERTERLIDRISQVRPHYLILAQGQPYADLWIDSHLPRLDAAVVFQIGGALDYLSGFQKRAPKILGDCGLEWAYRLSQAPKRLGPRYLKNGLFLLQCLFRRRVL